MLSLAAVLGLYNVAGSGFGRALARADAWFRIFVCASLLAAAASFAAGYPLESDRLALKVALFGPGIRVVPKPLGPALRRLLEIGPPGQRGGDVRISAARLPDGGRGLGFPPIRRLPRVAGT